MKTPWIEGNDGAPYFTVFGEKHLVTAYSDWEETVTMGKYAACREIFFSKKLKLPRLHVDKQTNTYSFIYRDRLYQEKVDNPAMLWNTAIRHLIEVYQPDEKERRILDGQ